MKAISPWPMTFVAAFLMQGVQAADIDHANVFRERTDNVSPSQQQAYEAGVKQYNACLRRNHLAFGRSAWAHDTGDTYSYTYLSGPMTWTNLDALDAAERPCATILRSAVDPHLGSEVSRLYRLVPDLSDKPANMSAPPPMLEFKYLTMRSGLEPYGVFSDVVGKFTTAATKSRWQGRYMTLAAVDADRGDPDFVVVRWYQSWKNFGEDIALNGPQFVGMLEHAYGAKKVHAMLESVNDAVQENHFTVDSFDPDLSYPQPAGVRN